MKKELLITLVLGITGFFWILVLLLYKPATIPSSQPPPASQTFKTLFTISEINMHNSENDCWIIVENHAYDVTRYLSEHPGGKRTIIPTCGSDATTAYNTKNQNQPHSSRAHQLLQDYYIGDIKP